MEHIKSAVYILRYSNNTVKIGHSQDIHRRLRQYRGYQKNGQDYKKLLIIKSTQPKQLERIIHDYVGYNYTRQGRFEIFHCRDQDKLVKQLKVLAIHSGDLFEGFE